MRNSLLHDLNINVCTLCNQPPYNSKNFHPLLFFIIPHKSEAVSKNTLFQISPYNDVNVGKSPTHWRGSLPY